MSMHTGTTEAQVVSTETQTKLGLLLIVVMFKSRSITEFVFF